ncbi:MAG: hypothetical protein UU05_C0055G0005 [Candidatus Curtissbacteria bacterium GW2011_GWA1_40_47]|nr:MAG: hypothetical protein UT95_C0022G0010 [Candidatus Curtissbacteria bacterium GW2011_GWB1_40_28]KKR64110.1 MAG: hypothetical protein UU05_C0055G0005 [Candidatus Curtissbacteria bacterium GW2011_GWA1_40_47]
MPPKEARLLRQKKWRVIYTRAFLIQLPTVVFILTFEELLGQRNYSYEKRIQSISSPSISLSPFNSTYCAQRAF